MLSEYRKTFWRETKPDDPGTLLVHNINCPDNFDDRHMTLKVKRTHIQDGCAVAFGATVMGGAVIERDTTLLPLSLVLKEMNMLTGTYEGSPAEPVSGSTLLPPIAPRRLGGGHPELPAKAPVEEENRFTGLTVSDNAKR